MDKKSLDVMNASKYLGISYQKMRKLIDAGAIKAVNTSTGKVRQMKRIKVTELDRFLDEGI